MLLRSTNRWCLHPSFSAPDGGHICSSTTVTSFLYIHVHSSLAPFWTYARSQPKSRVLGEPFSWLSVLASALGYLLELLVLVLLSLHPNINGVLVQVVARFRRAPCVACAALVPLSRTATPCWGGSAPPCTCSWPPLFYASFFPLLCGLVLKPTCALSSRPPCCVVSQPLTMFVMWWWFSYPTYEPWWIL